MSKEYEAVATKLGVRYLFGRWGIRLLPSQPGSRMPYGLFEIVPLDGWVTDPAEVERLMRERGLEL